MTDCVRTVLLPYSNGSLIAAVCGKALAPRFPGHAEEMTLAPINGVKGDKFLAIVCHRNGLVASMGRAHLVVFHVVIAAVVHAFLLHVPMA